MSSNKKDVTVISDLPTMERLVKRSYNLMWDGWDVVKTRRHPAAFFYKDGRFIKGKWYRTTRYPVTRAGWTVPSELFEA